VLRTMARHRYQSYFIAVFRGTQSRLGVPSSLSSTKLESVAGIGP
jgi:hypothetical protein